MSRKRREPPQALHTFPRFVLTTLLKGAFGGGPRVLTTAPTLRLTLKPAWHTRFVITNSIVTVRRRRVTLASYRVLARGRNLFKKARTVLLEFAVALNIRLGALGPRVQIFYRFAKKGAKFVGRGPIERKPL